MSLTAPFSVLQDFPGWTTGFDLAYRQEVSRSPSKTYVKDLGSPLWGLRAESKALGPNLLDYWRARLKYMENGAFTFVAYSMSRTYPILYPNGSWPTGGSFSGTTAVLNYLNANKKGIKVGSLPPSFKLSIGDYVSIAGNLHQVMEAATADGSGVTSEFEVRPHVWPGVVSGSIAVSIKRPSCLMKIVPGSVATDASLSGWGSVSFQGMESR